MENIGSNVNKKIKGQGKDNIHHQVIKLSYKRNIDNNYDEQEDKKKT